MEEWRHIQGLLDKIRSTGMGGISADDPAAIEKLQKKLDGLERSQLIMKEVNAYYRKHGKLDGCALLSPDQIEKLKASMASSWRSDPRPFESYQLTNNNAEIWRSDPRPFESYQLTNNNAEIRRVKARIEQLSKQAQREFSGWEFDGGRVEMNREDNRLPAFAGLPAWAHGSGSSRTTPSGRLTVWNVSSRCPAKSPPSFKRSPLSCRPCGNRAKKSRRSRKRKLRPAGMPSGKPRATLARGFLLPRSVRGPPVYRKP